MEKTQQVLKLANSLISLSGEIRLFLLLFGINYLQKQRNFSFFIFVDFPRSKSPLERRILKKKEEIAN